MNVWFTNSLHLAIPSQKSRVGACKARQWACPRFIPVVCGCIKRKRTQQCSYVGPRQRWEVTTRIHEYLPVSFCSSTKTSLAASIRWHANSTFPLRCRASRFAGSAFSTHSRSFKASVKHTQDALEIPKFEAASFHEELWMGKTRSASYSPAKRSIL